MGTGVHRDRFPVLRMHAVCDAHMRLVWTFGLHPKVVQHCTEIHSRVTTYRRAPRYCWPLVHYGLLWVRAACHLRATLTSLAPGTCEFLLHHTL